MGTKKLIKFWIATIIVQNTAYHTNSEIIWIICAIMFLISIIILILD